MIRPVLTELALFLTPFVLYAVFLWATRAGVFASGFVVVGSDRLADDRGARDGGRELRRDGAIRRRAAALDLCAGAYRGRQVRPGTTK